MLLANPELLILLSLLTISRELRGKSWCKNEGVGRMRALIGDPLPEDLSELMTPPPIAIAADQRRAAQILREHCAKCAKCSLGRGAKIIRPVPAVQPLEAARLREENR